GSHAKTRSAACAGAAIATSAAAARRMRWILFMGRLSEAVRTVRAQAHLVLEGPLVVDRAGSRAVLRELQAHARELARAPVEHHAVLARVPGFDTIGRESFRAQADAPAAHELVDALHIPARLRGFLGARAAQV